MGYQVHIGIILLALLMFACGSSSKNTTHKDSTDSARQANMNKDTIPVPPIPAPELAPNTIRAEGKIISLQHSKKGNGVVLKFEVQKSLGSGSSAPAVMANDTLDVQAANLPDSLSEGKIFVGEFQFRQVLSSSKDTSPSWLLVKIKNDKH